MRWSGREGSSNIEDRRGMGMGRGPSLGYTCSNGTCTCDKSIENDCADMSAVCTDATVDALINCINGWLTTHCTCTKAAVSPTPSPFTAPITTVKTLSSR